jgi:hypothetical protein
MGEWGQCLGVLIELIVANVSCFAQPEDAWKAAHHPHGLASISPFDVCPESLLPPTTLASDELSTDVSRNPLATFNQLGSHSYRNDLFHRAPNLRLDFQFNTHDMSIKMNTVVACGTDESRPFLRFDTTCSNLRDSFVPAPAFTHKQMNDSHTA